MQPGRILLVGTERRIDPLSITAHEHKFMWKPHGMYNATRYRPLLTIGSKHISC